MRLRTPTRFRTIAFAATLAIAAPVVAHQAQGPAGAPDPARVTAGTYAADPNHSLIGWRVGHFGFNDYFGIFGEVAGTLVLDPKNLAAAKVDVTIPVGKVTTVNPKLTAHLLKPGAEGKAPDFFGPSPTDARFVSKKVTVDGTRADILGDLTLNGITREVTLKAKFTGAGANPYSKKETVGFAAKTKIVRSQFNVNYDLVNLTDEVELDISVAFEKQ